MSAAPPKPPRRQVRERSEAPSVSLVVPPTSDGGETQGFPHFWRIPLNDSCSALLTISQRFHATGSINFLISRLTQARRSFGSIASSSQHRSPCLATNHRKRGSFRLSVAGNDGSAFTCFCVSAIRLSVT